MAFFLIAGVAAAEIHRAIRGGNRDKTLSLLREREEVLKNQLQEIQRELQQAKSQRELSSQEAAQLAAINAQLQADKDELEKESTTLKVERDELETRTERLMARQQLLEQCAESLKLENSLLLQQFERLKVAHEEESAVFHEQLQNLKVSVGAILQRFIAGELTAPELVQALAETGVALQCSEEDVTRLERVANTAEERVEALEQVELKVEDSWMQQMRLVTSSPSRAARLVLSGAAARGMEAVAAEARASTASTHVIDAAEQKAVALKLTAAAAGEAESADSIRAVHAEDASDKEVPSRMSSLVFRPIKKQVKKAFNKKQALVEVEVPLETMGRMSLDADMEAGGSMVPM